MMSKPLQSDSKQNTPSHYSFFAKLLFLNIDLFPTRLVSSNKKNMLQKYGERTETYIRCLKKLNSSTLTCLSKC